MNAHDIYPNLTINIKYKDYYTLLKNIKKYEKKYNSTFNKKLFNTFPFYINSKNIKNISLTFTNQYRTNNFSKYNEIYTIISINYQKQLFINKKIVNIKIEEYLPIICINHLKPIIMEMVDELYTYKKFDSASQKLDMLYSNGEYND